MSSHVTGLDFLHPSPLQRRQLVAFISVFLIFLAVVFFFWGRSVLSQAYLPHAVCYMQQPALVWTNVIADALIGLSYLIISAALGYLVYQGHRDIPFSWMFLTFGLFIIACGSTHFMEVVTVWAPVYVLSAGLKIFTAIVSICAAVALPLTIPRALNLIREARLSEERARALESAMVELNRAQDDLHHSNERLERQVRERTLELTQANEALRQEISSRREVEASLAKLASIVESSEDAIIRKDLTGTITSWNGGAEKIYGYTAAEAIGQPITMIMPDHRKSEATDLINRLASGQHINHHETERLTKRGEILDVSLTISPVYDSQGVLVGASTIARDITAAKRAEQALRDSEAQYRLMFESNPLPMWVFDRKTLKFLAVNEAAVRHYGFSRDEFFHMTIRDIRPDEEVPRMLQRMQGLQRGLQDVRIFRHRKKDGSAIDVEITSHDLNFRGADAELVLSHDITERLKGEERLRQSQERFAKAFRASGFGITISREVDGCYLDVNPAYLRMMGYERDEVVGRTVNELKIWVDPKQRALMIDQLGSSEPGKSIEVAFRTKSGEIRDVEVAAERILLDDQTCVLAMTHDVTKAKQLEKQFRQAQKMEAVGRLAGGVAHDFNNMLGVIIGYSEVARSRLEAGHPAQKHLSEIRKAGERAAGLTRQLLAFSRQQVLEPRTLNLNAVVHNLNKMLLHMIGEDVSLVFRPGEPLGSVRVDLGQIEQVLMNLAINSRDAMPKGGKITIETANVELDQGYLRQHQPVQPGPYVMLSVTDTGIGMDEATKVRLFEPFFTTKEVGKGTGLGLSTVYGIVKQSGGYVWVYSEIGQGATFKIYLPRVDQPAESLVETTEKALPAGTETVLVVEDEEALRKVTVNILESSGYTVLSATNATGALDLVRRDERKIHLLLTDVIMPGLTGPDLATELKSLRPDMKVVFMSGYAANMMQKGLLGPGSVLLVKPFSTNALLTKIRAVLES